jgi:hypothetical protein
MCEKGDTPPCDSSMPVRGDVDIASKGNTLPMAMSEPGAGMMGKASVPESRQTPGVNTGMTRSDARFFPGWFVKTPAENNKPAGIQNNVSEPTQWGDFDGNLCQMDGKETSSDHEYPQGELRNTYLSQCRKMLCTHTSWLA